MRLAQQAATVVILIRVNYEGDPFRDMVKCRIRIWSRPPVWWHEDIERPRIGLGKCQRRVRSWTSINTSIGE